jgi:LysR family transcriptional regulator, glycine cleavage system transcriptional activator
MHALLGFAAAARSGNLTRAAEAQNLTVSALSHQIRGLEERLGRQLFVRGPRGVRLTAEGERLLSRVAPHLEALEQALRPYGPRRDDILTLSLTPSMASVWLVPRLGAFLAAHPQLEINLQSSAAVVDFDRDRDVDAALRIGRGRWPGVVAEHLFDEWVAPVASPQLVERMGGLPGPGELQHWPLLGDPGHEWGAWFAHAGGQPPSRYVAYFDDSEALHRGAAAGVGVALGKLTRVRLLIEGGQLVQLSDLRLRTDYGHYLVYPQRSAAHAGLRAFRAWIMEEAARHAVDDKPAA